MLDPYIVTIGAKIATYSVGSQACRQIQILLKVKVPGHFINPNENSSAGICTRGSPCSSIGISERSARTSNTVTLLSKVRNVSARTWLERAGLGNKT